MAIKAKTQDRSPVAATRVNTLVELARHLGLSPTTVSFVLNGQGKRRKIAPKTVARVLAGAADVDYVSNALARGLRQKRTGAIGVVFPHLRSDWAHRIMKGVASRLDESGTIPFIVCHYGSGELERKLLQSLVERRVDGILCNPLADGFNRYRQVVERGVPLTFLSDAPTGLDEIGLAAWDPAVVGLVIDHLAGLGHQRIMYLGVRDNRRMSIANREVFIASMNKAKLTCRPQDMILRLPGERFEAAVEEALAAPEPPTAIFALYDDIAISVLKFLQCRGVSVPGQVSLATLGESPCVTEPGYGITTVSAPVEEEGQAAVDCLLQVIENPDMEPPHRLVSGGELIPGRTTGPCPS